jgi:hypothetical protein
VVLSALRHEKSYPWVRFMYTGPPRTFFADRKGLLSPLFGVRQAPDDLALLARKRKISRLLVLPMHALLVGSFLSLQKVLPRGRDPR